MTTATATGRTILGRLRPRRNPWRHPWFLEGFTWLYLIWSLVPVALAVLFSFNNGRSQSVWQGFSWRWYYADPVNSVLHDPNLHAAVVQTIRLSVYVTLITVPLGVAFALGINRWRGLVAATSNFVMILSFVLVDLLSSNSSNTPMSVYIYSQQRGGNGGPALNALGTIMLAMSFVIAIVGYLGYRFLTRGERGSGLDALTTIAGES